MNKETVSYIKHIMGSDFVRLDAFNVLLASAIIVTSLISFITNNIILFSVTFFIGSALAFFNCVKSIKKRFVLAAVGFVMISIVLMCIGILVLKYLAK